MIIGTFKSIGSSFTGIIQTLAFKTEAVFEPAEKKGDNSPDFRITTTSAQPGKRPARPAPATSRSRSTIRPFRRQSSAPSSRPAPSTATASCGTARARRRAHERHPGRPRPPRAFH
jgi:Protein of unknown function (DUF736)